MRARDKTSLTLILIWLLVLRAQRTEKGPCRMELNGVNADRGRREEGRLWVFVLNDRELN